MNSWIDRCNKNEDLHRLVRSLVAYKEQLTTSTQRMAEQIIVDWKPETKKIKYYKEAVSKELCKH